MIDPKPQWVSHIVQEGARFHVVRYTAKGMDCSEPMCEINKPNGEMVCPMEKQSDCPKCHRLMEDCRCAGIPSRKQAMEKESGELPCHKCNILVGKAPHTLWGVGGKIWCRECLAATDMTEFLREIDQLRGELSAAKDDLLGEQAISRIRYLDLEKAKTKISALESEVENLTTALNEGWDKIQEVAAKASIEILRNKLKASEKENRELREVLDNSYGVLVEQVTDVLRKRIDALLARLGDGK